MDRLRAAESAEGHFVRRREYNEVNNAKRGVSGLVCGRCSEAARAGLIESEPEKA